MKKTNKKGFTIVELVIVIAVIAILAAVLIPNISRLVKKANQSADESLVRNLNTALAMDAEKHTTMSAALKAAYENGGYDVAKIVTKNDDAKILWDSLNDCFVYLNGTEKVYLPNTQTEKDVKDWNYFEICNEMPKTQTYSIYANWEGTTLSEKLTVGFDAGNNVFESLTFETDKERSVIINTNGGALTVKAGNATVSHYGVANAVKVTAVADKSYHECGEVVGNLEIVKGRVEFAKTAIVNTVLVSSANAGDVKIDVVSGANVGTVAPTTESAKTDVSNSATIPADSKVTEVVTINTDFAGGLGTEKSPYLIATEEQFANINKLYAQKTGEGVVYNGTVYHFKQAADIEFSKLVVLNVFTGTYDGNGNTISFAETVKYSYAYLFDTVFGTTTVKNLHYVLGKNQPITLINQTDWKVDQSNLTIQNVEIDSKGETILANGSNFGLYANYIMVNVSRVRFIDCSNKANLNNTGTSTGVFLGSGWFFNKGEDVRIEFSNCSNSGDITGTAYVGVLYGNAAYVGLYDGNSKAQTEYSENNFAIENVKNTGKLTAIMSTGMASVTPKSEILLKAITNNGSSVVGGCFDSKVVNLDTRDFTINAIGVGEGITYKVAFNISCIINEDKTTESNTTKYFFDLAIDSTVGQKVMTGKYVAVSEKVAAEKNINTAELTYKDGIAFYVDEANDITYLVFKNETLGDKTLGKDSSGETSATVFVYAYDQNNLCIGVLAIKK